MPTLSVFLTMPHIIKHEMAFSPYSTTSINDFYQIHIAYGCLNKNLEKKSISLAFCSVFMPCQGYIVSPKDSYFSASAPPWILSQWTTSLNSPIIGILGVESHLVAYTMLP